MFETASPTQIKEQMQSCVDGQHCSQIYYSTEHDNFYCKECNRGMGLPFYLLAKAMMQIADCKESPHFPNVAADPFGRAKASLIQIGVRDE